MLSIEFFCPLPNGLHARPAWALKEQCSAWRSDIRFINRRLHTHADAKSSLALISTGTLFNDSCVLEINGSDEEQARRVLEAYLTGAFIDSDSIPSGDAPHVAHPLPRSLVRLAPHLQHGITLASGIGAGRAITSNVIVRSPPRRKILPAWNTAWRRWPNGSTTACAGWTARVKPFSARIFR